MTQHFHNTFIILLYFILTCKELTIQQFMFITFSQQIISSRLLQVVIGEQKSSFIGKFKLEPITIYQI